MLIRGNSELGVWGDLDLRLRMIMAIKNITGDAYNPPGMKSIMKPIINGIHHVFEVWAEFSSLLGIQV